MVETNNINTNDEIEIDLGRLMWSLLRKWKTIVLATILGASIALSYTVYMITPLYKASSMIYILNQTTSVTSLTDLQMGTQLAQDFEILATSRPVVEAVIEELNLDTTYEGLLATIDVTNIDDSRMIQLTVTNANPYLAADISNSLAEALRTRVAEIMDTDKPTKVEDAVVPSNPISPSKSKNTVIGGMLGMMAVVGIYTLIFLLDDTIKTADDVSKYLNLNTIARIPINQGDDKGSKKKRLKFGGK